MAAMPPTPPVGSIQGMKNFDNGPRRSPKSSLETQQRDALAALEPRKMPRAGPVADSDAVFSPQALGLVLFLVARSTSVGQPSGASARQLALGNLSATTLCGMHRFSEVSAGIAAEPRHRSSRRCAFK